MSGYFMVDPDVWPEVAALFLKRGRAWSKAEAITDLRWWEDSVRAGRADSLPKLRALAERWTWGRKAVTRLLYNVESWAPEAHVETAAALVDAVRGRAPTRTRTGPEVDQDRTRTGPAKNVESATCEDAGTSAGPVPDQDRTRTGPNARGSSVAEAESRDQKQLPEVVDLPEIDHVVTLCELYREHSHRLTRTGRRGRIGDSPGLRRMWGSALEVAEDHGYDAETLIAMFRLVFTTKRGDFWQRGGKGNQEIVSGSGLVTYLLRCKGSTYGTGQPTREKLVQRLAEAQEYLDDSAAIEQMRAAHMANAGPSRPPRALQVASECQDIGKGTEASTEALRAFSGRGGK